MKAIGAYSANEIRQKEDMNPHEFGDTYYENVNSVPANQMGDWIQAKIDSMDATQAQNNNPNGNN
jgi:hypothetical protein